MKRRDAFDAIAAEYDAVRPGYPAELVERVLARASGRLLEVGCGTGIATRPFAEAGNEIVCLEPGASLAGIARRKLAPFPRVSVIESYFEDWPEEPHAFDMVFSATAWHHVDRAVRVPKAARVLTPGGTLAVYQNRAETNFLEGQDAYDTFVPEWKDEPGPKPVEKQVADTVAEMETHLTDVESHVFRWTRTHTADGYIRLLNTYSDHSQLPDAQRNGLYDALHRVIEDMGGTVEREYLSVLFLALAPA